MRIQKLSATIIVLLLSILSFGQNDETRFYNLEKAFESPLQVKTLDLRGNGIESLPDSINKFKNLEVLLISDNNLINFPITIVELKKIKTIDLSNNKFLDYGNTFNLLSNHKKLNTLYLKHLETLPDNIDTLKYIKNLDLSYCKNINYPYNIGNLKKLNSLTLKHANIENIASLLDTLKHSKKLKRLTLHNNNIVELPVSLSELTSIKFLDIQGAKLYRLPNNISNLTKLKSLNISLSPNLNYDSLFYALENSKKLENLTLQSCGIKELPNSIGKLEKLNQLDISGNVISSFPKSISSLSNLSYLNIRGNKLSDSTINKLKIRLPKCHILYDNKVKQKGINAPIENIKVEQEEFTVNSNEKSEIKTQSGTIIKIPENAFTDNNGEIITGDVRIVYEEYNNALDIFLSGIPMDYNYNGVDYSFISGGMFRLEAYKGEEKLSANPKPENQIRVNLVSFNLDEDMSIYYFDEENNEWIEKESSITTLTSAPVSKPLPPRMPQKEDIEIEAPVKEIITQPLKPIFAYDVYDARVYVVFNKKNNDLLFTIKLPNTPPGKDVPKYQYKEFFEIEYLKQFSWVINKSSSLEYERFKNIIKSGKNISNLIIEKSKEDENYNLSIFFKKDSLKIYATPKDIANPSNTFSYNKYYSLYEKRIKLWDKIEVKYSEVVTNYNNAIAQYDSNMITHKRKVQKSENKYENDLKDYNKKIKKHEDNYKEELKEYESQLANYNELMKEWKDVEIYTSGTNIEPRKSTQEIVMTSLGLWNCDRIDYDAQRELLAKFKDSNKNDIEPKFIYVLNDNKRRVNCFFGNQEITYDWRCEISLFVLLQNEEVGYVSPKDFRKSSRRIFSKKNMTPSIVNTKDIDAKDFRKSIINFKG